MNTYYAEISFKKGPSFSVQTVYADSEEQAKNAILKYAKNTGFTYPIKKIIVKLN